MTSLELKIEERSAFKRFDWNFVAVIVTLHVIGLINLYSAAYSTDHLSRVFYAQMMWIPIGWVAFFIFWRINFKDLLKYSPYFYWLNILALLLVPLIGKRIYGARRWIDLGFFNYQPSETMKLFLVLYMGSFLAKNKLENFGFKDLVRPGIILLLPFLLTARQPDLGTALLLFAIPASMILFLKVQRKVILTIFATLSVSLPIVWSYGLKDYQKNRVLNFLNPERDPRGTGYNSIQAKIAIGSGQILGRGFQQGSQNQLQFLPERHSDFIFCVLSEEYGFIGAMFTLAFFLILLFIILNIARESQDRGGALICVGFAAFIFWHMIINIGMVAGLLPIVGVPLPLLSYGGSSMVTFMTSLGIVSSVGNRRFMF
ncbi:MAG: rod shape-determining protein RodA [Pseudomonadota bacterium]